MTREEKAALRRAVSCILRKWQIDESGARLLDLEHMRLIFTIHIGLRRQFRDPAQGYAWMRRPNAIFEGRTPVEMIVAGASSDLLRLAAYLQAEDQLW